MRQFVKLDPEVESLLRCALCKAELLFDGAAANCSACGSLFPMRAVHGGETYDFRIRWPSGLWPDGWQKWRAIQRGYENWSADEAQRAARPGYYQRELDSVKEIYEVEFRIDGRVLDVGGHQGRLRHHLLNGTDVYVVVDPFEDVFRNVTPSLLHAYPCLEEPVNFILAYGEFLPVAAGSFDWVHLRSVLDHLYDPWLALKEAWRVLRPKGRILVGLTVEERVPTLGLKNRVQKKLRDEGLRGLVSAVGRRALKAVGGRIAKITHGD